MPTLYTHYKFGNDVLNKLNNNQKESIKKEIKYYNMFNQGFDNLYYYHIHWKYYKNFGVRAHKKKVDIFFKNIFKFIKENKLENDSSITNMIYGFINHYTLDTIMHPYINYQVKNLKIPHTKIEFMLDAIYINNNPKFKWKNKIYKTLIPKLKFNKNLINTINYTFNQTHDEKNIGKIFNKSHNNSYYIYRYFINDNHKIKSFLYKIIDYLMPNLDTTLHENTFNINIFDKRILNNQKNIWHHPNNNKETYDYSIQELYNYALKISIKLNKEANKVLNNKLDIQTFLDNINLINLKNMKQLLKK